MRVRCLIVAIAIPLAACRSNSDPVVSSCAGVGSSQLYVVVRDARSGVPAAQGATVSGSRRNGSDVATVSGVLLSDSVLVVEGVPGTYDLTIKKAGYQDLVLTNVVVGVDALCGKRYSVSAALQPLS